MRDQRLERLAHILVNYSVAVKPGELVRISGSTVSEALVIELYREVLAAGGQPYIRMYSEMCEELLFRLGTDEQIAFISPLAYQELEALDCSITLWGEQNTRALTSVDPARQALASKARAPLHQAFTKRVAAGGLRRVGTEFPTQAGAQEAEMSLREWEDFVLGAGFVEAADPVALWQEIGQRQQIMCDRLEQGRELRFTTPNGTDLSMAITGRRWLNADGHVNFPDGEVYSGPLEDSTSGIFCTSYPAVFEGHEVTGIRLKFDAGRVVEASADKGEDFLVSMLDQDEGARVLGEVAFGTNYAVTQSTRNLLFDEKIGGTFHVALGSSYPESGGVNESGLHWDLVCNLREGGTVALDGETICVDGRFLDPAWPQPPQIHG